MISLVTSEFVDRLGRRRSELRERTFAHVCHAGGMRRSWLRGVIDLGQRYLIAVAAHNLGRILRTLCGCGKPRSPQTRHGLAALLSPLFAGLMRWSAGMPHRTSTVDLQFNKWVFGKTIRSMGC